jgi:hypothetical protein
VKNRGYGGLKLQFERAKGKLPKEFCWLKILEVPQAARFATHMYVCVFSHRTFISCARGFITKRHTISDPLLTDCKVAE